MDYYALTAVIYAVLLPLLGAIIGLLILYGIIRVAISRGLRDHHKWLELNRPSAQWQDDGSIDASNHGRR